MPMLVRLSVRALVVATVSPAALRPSRRIVPRSSDPSRSVSNLEKGNAMAANSNPKQLLSRLLQGVTVIIGLAIVLNKAVIQNAPYEFGAQFVATDPRITAVTGRNSKTELRLLRGFRFKESEQTGSARMTIKATGAKGEFDVALWLEKRDGRWALDEASVSPVDGPVVYRITN